MSARFGLHRLRGTLAIAIVGLLAGTFVSVDVAALRTEGVVSVAYLGWRIGAGAAIGMVALLLLRAAARATIARVAPRALEPGTAYARHDALTYGAFLLPAAGWAGVHVSVPLAWTMLLLFVAGQTALVLRGEADASASTGFFASDAYLALLFLFSGMAALVYEVVWQRVLYATYGINIESVTLIVAVFMLGLGLGALAGGYLSRRYPQRLPELFALAELSIGAFGAVSIPVIQAVGDRTLHFSTTGVALAVFAMMAPPTMLMGATLPILVAHVTRHDPNVGASMGRLYALNTLGAALASLLTVDVLFALMGRQASVIVAVALNVTVGLLVYRSAARLRARPPPQADDLPARSAMPRAWVLAVAAVVGFVSLSQEILWVRLIAFATMSVPHVFAHVLGAFLVGLAIGAHDARRICLSSADDLVGVMARRLGVAATVYYLAVPLVAHLMTVNKGVGLVASYFVVGFCAYLIGALLPMLTHVGTPRGAVAGLSVAWIYVANILGCTAGPLVTAFVLLDRFPIERCAFGLALLGLSTAAALWLGSSRRAAPARATLPLVAALALLLLAQRGAYERIYEKLLWGPEARSKGAFAHVVENRSGVLAVASDPAGDVMYGGGAYDGRFSIDPVANSNLIDRAFAIASLHRAPRRALVIGLSTGSWVRVLATHQAVERVVVVEINPGYERLISLYPGHRDILTDPRISYAYDDGRRWLQRHPDERFDFILMNTTQHYRSNVTSLLSREFLEICRAHLEPGGVLYYNATRSLEAIHTAAATFPHVTLFGSFVAASDSPIVLSEDERFANLARFVLDGQPLLTGAVRDRLARHPLPDVAATFRARRDLDVVTDDNMLTELKRIRSDVITAKLYRLYDPDRAWPRALSW